ncbi:GNAT family N-acetyltransferase [Thermococcus sp.]
MKVHENNVPSIRVLEKNGFTLSGRFREHVWSDGKYLDELIYEKFRRKVKNKVRSVC